MVTETLTTYEMWEVTVPTIPARSRLYPLEPIGMGTPQVESLSSYLARLAEAHSVLLSKLVRGEIFPCFGRPHLTGNITAFWTHYARAMNGTSRWAKDLVQVLEELTKRQDLHLLTLLPWSEVLSGRGLLRHNRAWCPMCLEMYRQTEAVIYEPLLWSLAAVTICPAHRQPLHLCCPHCQKPLPWLKTYTRPGYCSHCRCWLGASAPREAGNQPRLAKNEPGWQLWVANVAGDLLAAAPTLSNVPQKEQIVEMMTMYVEQVAVGQINQFRRIFQAHNFHNTERLRHWQVGRSLPQFSYLLQLCYCLGTTPLRFLIGDINVDQPIKLNFLDMNDPKPQARRIPKIDSDQLQQILATTLASDEEPPLSLNQLAKSLGYCGHSALAHRFPEQSRAISDRYEAYQKRKNLERKQRIQNEIRQATYQVYNLGVYPREKRVAELLSKPNYLQSPAGRTAWHKALQDLGLRKSDG